MKLINYAEHLTFISPLILFFAIVIGVYFIKKLDRAHRLILFYLTASLGIDITSRIMGNVANNNLILFFIIGLLDILVFTLLYLNFIKKKKLIGLIALAGISFISFEIFKTDIQNVSSFQEYSNAVVSVSIIMMSLIFLGERIVLETKTPKYIQFLNIVCLFYFTFQLIFLLPLNYLINEEFNSVLIIWLFRIMVLFTFYSILLSLLWKNGRTQN